jgi:hypothetical protein
MGSHRREHLPCIDNNDAAIALIASNTANVDSEERLPLRALA